MGPGFGLDVRSGSRKRKKISNWKIIEILACSDGQIIGSFTQIKCSGRNGFGNKTREFCMNYFMLFHDYYPYS